MDSKTYLSSQQRAVELGLIIDPSFVNHRKAQTIIGRSGMQCVDQAISQLPSLPEWQRTVRIDHIYSEAMLLLCEHIGIRPMQDILATRTGQLFCSTEKLLPCPDIYDSKRTCRGCNRSYAREFSQLLTFSGLTWLEWAGLVRGSLERGAPLL